MNNLRTFGGTMIFLMAASAAHAAQQKHVEPMAIESVKVDLPVSTETFPPGPGVELTGVCLICHSADMVLKQPLMSADVWREEIIKMRVVYGAPLNDSDIEPLTVYMTSLNANTQQPEK